MANIQHLMGYLEYLFAAKGKHSVHSPFLYQFVTQVIQGYTADPDFERIEKIRTDMLRSEAVIHVKDYGASARDEYQIKLSKLVSRAAKSSKYCRLLYRIIYFLQPRVCIELGTNVAISATYQALALPEGAYLHTIEGSSSLAEIAVHNLNKMELSERVQVHNASFEDRYPQILNHVGTIDYLFVDGNHSEEATMKAFHQALPHCKNETVMIFDDINWSTGMQSAWMQIKEHPSVTATIDLYFMGIVFFRKELSKEDFLIRF